MSASPSATAVEQGGIAGQNGRRHILLIEDDPRVAETFAELLELEGFRVTVAQDAPAGLQAARREPLDVVLCDLTLGGEMDGCEFARTCRRDDTLQDLHLIAISGYNRAEDRARARASGFDQLIGKPLGLDDVLAVVAAGRPQ